MGFLEWVGIKQQKPDYSMAERFWQDFQPEGDIAALRESRLEDWQGMSQKALRDILNQTRQWWGGTGADTLGITSSIPAERGERGYGDWMGQVGIPGMRAIEQEFMQNKMQADQYRWQMYNAMRSNAEAEAAAQTGSGLGFLGGLASIAAAPFTGGASLAAAPAMFGMGGGQMEMPPNEGFMPTTSPYNYSPWNQPGYQPYNPTRDWWKQPG